VFSTWAGPSRAAEAGSIEALCTILKSSDNRIVLVSLEGINNVLKLSASLAGNPYYRRVRAAKADHDIMQLQNHHNDEIARMATNICENFVLRPVWATDNHSRWPADFQAAVRTMLLVHTRVGETPFSLLPHDVLLHIVEMVAADWELDERVFKESDDVDADVAVGASAGFSF
jgi:hypothetical protein